MSWAVNRLLAVLFLCGLMAPPAMAQRGEAIVIAHRGASGYLPEHTIEAYEKAIDMGADFIEPDLVFTRDGVLVARHDRWLSDSTDVADHPEFASRKTLKPGRAEADWYAEDFTFAELSTLRARQAFPGRGNADDGKFLIPRFEEVLELARDAKVGVYPEAKDPAALAAQGHDFTAPLLNALGRYGFGPGGLPVFIQSFDPDFLRGLRNRTRIPLVMLIDFDNGAESLSLEEAAAFADGVGPFKALLIDPQGADTGYVKRAHKLGLLVHPYTFRNDGVGAGFADAKAELQAFLALGIDGLFTDFPDTAVSVRGAR